MPAHPAAAVDPIGPDPAVLAQGMAATLTLHSDWMTFGHPETFRFHATALSTDVIIAGLSHHYDSCRCTATVWPANSIIDGPFPLPTAVFTPHGPWTVAGRFDSCEHPNPDHEQWGDNQDYPTLGAALTAARALHLQVCAPYRRTAGRCATCHDTAEEHLTQDPRWCADFYPDPYGCGPNAEGQGPAVNRP